MLVKLAAKFCRYNTWAASEIEKVTVARINFIDLAKRVSCVDNFIMLSWYTFNALKYTGKQLLTARPLHNWNKNPGIHSFRSLGEFTSGSKVTATRPIHWPGCIILPAGHLTSSSLSSRCLRTNSKPHSASTRPMLYVQYRSDPLRVNMSCSVCWSMTITSPGSIPG